MMDMTDGTTLALPESFIAVILRHRYGMDVRDDGVGSLIVNGKRMSVPYECTRDQAMQLIQDRLAA
jgi:hypothetical protein